MRILIVGLTITSSWGNGHATTYRALCRALHARGHSIVFVEKDVEWYASHRDLASPPYCTVRLYADWELDGRALCTRLAKECDVVVIGSYFPDGVAASDLLLAQAAAPVTFYDIDTPITLAALREAGRTDYLDARHIPAYGAYMSFTGGPVLAELQSRFGAQRAVPLYCSVDPESYHETPPSALYQADLSYLGTYAQDRQAKLLDLLNAPAATLPEQAFLVAGPMYPRDTPWAANTRWLSHLAPAEHPVFYSSVRFTLNLTRDAMVRAGYSPSVRLFEASACGAAILSDPWPGMEDFLTPGEEILLVETAEDVTRILEHLGEAERKRLGGRARERILAAHTAAHRAEEFERIVAQLGSPSGARLGTGAALATT